MAAVRSAALAVVLLPKGAFGAPEPCEWPDPPPGFVARDVNGKACTTCNPPPPERLTRHNYTVRTDCGSLANTTGLLPGAMDIPVLSLMRPATDSRPFTNAMCELNQQKGCVDAVDNEDYMYYAKGITLDIEVPACIKHWDGQYCLQNGFLDAAIVQNVHNFHVMKAVARVLCAGKYAQAFNLSAITLGEEQAKYFESIQGGDTPTQEQSEYIAAWNCAMGDLACDMTYCAYTFCDKGDGSTGIYGECKGWDQVSGMPVAPFDDDDTPLIWISVGVIAFFVIGVICAFYCYRRNKAKTDELGTSLAPVQH